MKKLIFLIMAIVLVSGCVTQIPKQAFVTETGEVCESNEPTTLNGWKVILDINQIVGECTLNEANNYITCENIEVFEYREFPHCNDRISNEVQDGDWTLKEINDYSIEVYYGDEGNLIFCSVDNIFLINNPSSSIEIDNWYLNKFYTCEAPKQCLDLKTEQDIMDFVQQKFQVLGDTIVKPTINSNIKLEIINIEDGKQDILCSLTFNLNEINNFKTIITEEFRKEACDNLNSEWSNGNCIISEIECLQGEDGYRQCNYCFCSDGKWVCSKKSCSTCDGEWIDGVCEIEEEECPLYAPCIYGCKEGTTNRGLDESGCPIACECKSNIKSFFDKYGLYLIIAGFIGAIIYFNRK